MATKLPSFISKNNEGIKQKKTSIHLNNPIEKHWIVSMGQSIWDNKDEDKEEEEKKRMNEWIRYNLTKPNLWIVFDSLCAINFFILFFFFLKISDSNVESEIYK